MSNENKLETALIIGRWQPWHEGHRELFKAALKRAERVAIGVRTTTNIDNKNPFSFDEVKKFIDDDLKKEFEGKYTIIELPNITNVIYGRDVGYNVEKINFEKDIEDISATEKRKSMNITPVSHDVLSLEREKRNNHKGCVIWLTGLSGSGKTTIARALERQFFDQGNTIYMLDGDNLRSGLNSNLGFSFEDRKENVRRIGEVAALFARAGFIVITAFISPFAEDRKKALAAFKDNSYEIYLSASIDVCEKRDPKGLYKKARLGEIKDFTGIDSPYEIPTKPALILNTDKETKEVSINKLYNFIISKISNSWLVYFSMFVTMCYNKNMFDK